MLGLLTNLVVGCPEARARLAAAPPGSSSSNSGSSGAGSSSLLQSLVELLFAVSGQSLIMLHSWAILHVLRRLRICVLPPYLWV